VQGAEDFCRAGNIGGLEKSFQPGSPLEDRRSLD